MSKYLSLATGVVLAASSVTFAIPFTVDSTGILDPNPSAIAITEVGNTSLAASRVLLAAAHTANLGGVVDFQQQFQGGTFPNAPTSANGVDIANGPTNPLSVTSTSAAGTGGLVATGTAIFSFYRLESTATGTTVATGGANNFDSNTNNGIYTVSGGYKSRYPGAVSPTNPLGDGNAVSGNVDFGPAATPNPTPIVDAAAGGTTSTGVTGSYEGVTNLASPATLVFNNPLSFFGITAVARSDGNARTPTFTLTFSDASTLVIGGTTVVSTAAAPAEYFGYQLTAAQIAAGVSISRATLSEPTGNFVRLDDLAFIVATPEPASLSLLGLGGMALIRRRRA